MDSKDIKQFDLYSAVKFWSFWDYSSYNVRITDNQIKDETYNVKSIPFKTSSNEF